MNAKSFSDRFRTRYQKIVAINMPLKGLRAYLNWALANYEMLRQTSRIRAKPLKLTFDPTNVCQLRCPLCPTGLRIHDRNKGFASHKLFKNLMDEVGDYVFFIDFFNWGEPLLNIKSLVEMVRMASGKKIFTRVSSNLSLPLSDEDIKCLIECGLNELWVSLDGASQKTYSNYRRQGKFSLVFDNMHRIVNMKHALGVNRPNVVWRFLVFRFNEHEIEKARQMAKEIGVDHLMFESPYLDEGLYPLSKQDKEAMKSWCSQYPEFNRHDPSHSDYADVSIAKRFRCDWHYISSAINWDGTIAPCCGVFKKEDDFGSLGKEGETSYMEVINNRNFRAVRDLYARRTKESTGLVCDNCTSTEMWVYSKLINREILHFTIVRLIESLRRRFMVH